MAHHPEALFKKRLKTAFLALYGQDTVAWSFVPSFGQPNGIPDQAFGAAGRFTWIESKVGKSKMRPIQRLQCGRLVAAGQRVLCCTLQDDTVQVETLAPDGEATELRHYPVESIVTRPFWEAILNVT